MAASIANVERITERLNDFLAELGFEVYPLKVGWYNSMLGPSLRLSYPDDTLAVVVLSTPAMFEQAFLPFLKQRGCHGLSDPIDQCVKHHISSGVAQYFPAQKVDIMYDYEMLPSRKPKFLAQTAAHVAGAAYYYRQADITDQPWGEKKMYGVCVHPRFGGWFAIRGLLVFDGVAMGSELVQAVPTDCVPCREARIQLLEAFNFHWKDSKYRDIVPPVQKYSQKQQEYFSTPPAQRFALLRSWGVIPDVEDKLNTGTDTQAEIGAYG